MPEPGMLVGDRYRLVRPIGDGGMGSVWAAEHTTLGRVVAVKFLSVVGSAASEAARRSRPATR